MLIRSRAKANPCRDLHPSRVVTLNQELLELLHQGLCTQPFDHPRQPCRALTYNIQTPFPGPTAEPDGKQSTAPSAFPLQAVLARAESPRAVCWLSSACPRAAPGALQSSGCSDLPVSDVRGMEEPDSEQHSLLACSPQILLKCRELSRLRELFYKHPHSLPNPISSTTL